jgi:hypothetical protein
VYLCLLLIGQVNGEVALSLHDEIHKPAWKVEDVTVTQGSASILHRVRGARVAMSH